MADYDIVIIGGGIHGVGVAQAAVAAGYKTLLLERRAIAAGTSSRSSKLIHGGLRYLENWQWRLVRESLRERALLLRNAPDLVRLQSFHIPLYEDSGRRPWQIRAGLTLYNVLGGFARTTRFRALPRRQWDQLDGLKTENLQAVFRYFDAQTDDAALTKAVMRSAMMLGAELACPGIFVSAQRESDGYRVRYTLDTHAQECGAAVLVNAAGPWLNEVLKSITPAPRRLPIDLVQGAHIVLDARLSQGIYYTEAPADRRAVFIMPWQDRTLVGTTETTFHGDPAKAQASALEIRYLQRTVRHYFPDLPIEPVASFAGIRVLPQEAGPAFHRSRETVLLTDTAHAPRLVTIYGGKLTGYRATAAKVLRCLESSLPARRAVADTARLRLSAD